MSLVAESNEPIFLNNVGIHMISKGQYQNALRVLSRGLSLVKQEMMRQEESSKDASEDDDGEAPPGVFLQQLPECGSSILSSIGVQGYTFSSPMFIQALQQEIHSLRDNVKISFVILYNIALAHHLLAIQDVNFTQKLLKAKYLYELVYTIQINEEIEISPLQAMAISNNLGQIHLSLGDEDKSRSCFEHLLSAIISLNACGEHESVGNLDGFIGNVLLLFLKSAPTAPAA